MLYAFLLSIYFLCFISPKIQAITTTTIHTKKKKNNSLIKYNVTKN